MANLGSLVTKIRSKNAGPFWITVDIFCGSDAVFEKVCHRMTPAVVASLTGLDAAAIRRFEMRDLLVLKLSFARHHVQGSRFDRDMHGAQIATLFAEWDIL
ncbi:MAG: DUF4387 family protein [Candidatus Puniceispirillum sp.]|jgi:hypothetical protein|uniref:DUF4387 family protein n=1 Tax=Candidatus Puniceispirillum sp. TaxID=2026719 RepID=UPI001ED2E40A|nr:DUF4387 family protein [Candidatus Puniceispirillum sp.]MBT6414954.1 DUF4387 family protein [Candidatus Puniceispirillum sp.]MBT6566932.1 DUF4387 family protein [Candidatus Puniceispirillum sp.]